MKWKNSKLTFLFIVIIFSKMEEYGSIGDMFTRFMEIFYNVEEEKKILRFAKAISS